MANQPAEKAAQRGNNAAPTRRYDAYVKGYMQPPGAPLYSFGQGPVAGGGMGPQSGGGNIPLGPIGSPAGKPAPNPSAPPQQAQAPAQGGGGQSASQGGMGGGSLATKGAALTGDGGTTTGSYTTFHGKTLDAPAPGGAAPQPDAALWGQTWLYDGKEAQAVNPQEQYIASLQGDLASLQFDPKLYQQMLASQLAGLQQSRAQDQMAMEQQWAGAGLAGSGFAAEDLTGLGQRYAAMQADMIRENTMQQEAAKAALAQQRAGLTGQIAGMESQWTQQLSQNADAFYDVAWSNRENTLAQIPDGWAAKGQFQQQYANAIMLLRSKILTGEVTQAQAERNLALWVDNFIKTFGQGQTGFGVLHQY